MYIKKYWGNFIGGSDDSLNLVAFLEDQKKEEIPLSEIFAKIGLDKQNWDFRQTVEYLEFTHSSGVEMDFHFAIDVVTDLAAILLECSVSGSVNLLYLMSNFSLTAAAPAHRSARAAIRRQLERASSLYAPDPFLCWIKKTPRASLFKDRLAQGAKRPQRRRRIRRRMWSLLQTKSVFLRTAEHTISASDFLPSQNL